MTRRGRKSTLFGFLTRFASRRGLDDIAENPERSPPATVAHLNTIGRIVSRLRLPRNARILDIGGAPYLGRESIDWIVDTTDAPIDVVAARADQAEPLREKYGAKLRVFGSISELDYSSYDLIVITPVLLQIAHTFRVLLPFVYADLVRTGGFVVVGGIGAARAAEEDIPGMADELLLFDQQLDLQRVRKGAEIARGLFKYRGHEWRKPSTQSYFVWVTLQRSDKPAISRPGMIKWWTLLPPGNSHALAAGAAFLEAFYDGFETEPAAAFDLLPADETVAPEAVHHTLRALLNARKIAAYEEAVARLQSKGYSELAFYHRLNLDRYDGVFRCDLNEALLRYKALPAQNFLKRAFLNILIDQLARSLDRDLLLSLLSTETPDRLRALPQAIAIGVCSALCKLGLLPECRRLMDLYLMGRSQIQRLQFLEIERDLGRKQGRTSGNLEREIGDWRAVLETVRMERAAFLGDHVSAAESAAYAALAAVPDGPNDLLDIRFSDDQQHRLKQVIEQSVIAGRPLSLVRLGDGESYAFDNSETNAALREMTWWGERPDDVTRMAIKRRVCSAVESADILGIPSIYRIIRHLTDPVSEDRTDETSPLFSLSAVLTAIADRGLLTGRVVTEERCHQLIFHREYLEQLTNASRRTIWVTCWSSGQLGLRNTDDRVFVTIPAHAKTRDLGNGEDQPLFNVFDAKIAQMCDAIVPGSVVFVSAGLIGKIFIAEAAKRGAVALDIGAMADYLAGRKTRTSADII
jgi:hypothetical protein